MAEPPEAARTARRHAASRGLLVVFGAGLVFAFGFGVAAGCDLRLGDVRRLQRQVDLDESNYTSFLGKSEDARLLEELDRRKMVNIAVIERAARPVQPSSLSTRMRGLIGAAVGLAAGLAAAAFLELISRS